jgi:ADP-ribose pyrophosphatase
MWNQRSHEQVDRRGEDDEKERQPADLGGDRRPRLSHPSMLRGATQSFRQLVVMEQLPEVLASSRRFEGRVFDVRVDDLRHADGSEQRVDVVEHGASLAIVATPRRDKLLLVRQYRHPTRLWLWEIPAGTAEPGEVPIDGAKRELREETGYVAGRIRPIGSVWTTPGFCSEVMHFYHADELIAGEPAFDDDEQIEVGTFTFQAAWRLVAAGVADAKTVLALYWLQGGEDEIGSEFGRYVL